MTFRLGLTGSIGMGKSTTAQLFAAEGCAVWDADAAVHRLYAKGGAAVQPIECVFPAVIEDGSVSRDKLRSLISEDPSVLKRIEEIVHPLVAEDRKGFLDSTTSDIAVLDIPLLFETGAENMMDAVVCVTISPEKQLNRILSRGTMSSEQAETIITAQMSDAEKRRRADYVIVTDTLEHARQQVQDVIADIKRHPNYA